MKKIGLFLAVGIGIATAIWVAVPASKKGFNPVNATSENLAVKGFDTVAYFTAQAAVEGKPELAYVWKGAKWLFSNRENLEKFRANPEAFAPQFGGYCAYAVSHGYTADGDPQVWRIVDGKLFLNYSPQVKELWEREPEKFIADGTRNWREFQTNAPEHKGGK